MKFHSLMISTLALAAATWGAGVTALRADEPQVGIGITIGMEEPPTFVEEGATFNGTLVFVPNEVHDYVFINDGWYYYHPSLHTWVHTKHEKDWRPPANGHIYKKWSEHPDYHRK